MMRSIAIAATNAMNGATYATVAPDVGLNLFVMPVVTQITRERELNDSIVLNHNSGGKYNVAQDAVLEGVLHDSSGRRCIRPAHGLGDRGFHRQQRQSSRLGRSVRG